MEPTYHRFDLGDVPGSAVPLPHDLPLPGPPNPPSAETLERIPEGRSYLLYEDGQLRLLFGRTGGITAYLWLAHGVPHGYFWAHKVGEMFYANGTMEDFSPWDDSSPPYPATTSFEGWVRGHFRMFALAGT